MEREPAAAVASTKQDAVTRREELGCAVWCQWCGGGGRASSGAGAWIRAVLDAGAVEPGCVLFLPGSGTLAILLFVG